MRATVIVPTYQEADNIAVLLRRIRVAAPSVHVVVVDDGSPDGTADVAEAVGAEVGHVEVLRRPAKDGLASAYQAGFAHAILGGAEIVITMDADHSHDPAVIPQLVEASERGADLVIGSRYIPGGRILDWTASRRVLSLWGNRYATAALRLPVSDATSGYRAYRADVVNVEDLSRIRASGYGFIIEMAYRLVRAGGKLVEVPITFVDRQHGSSKISSHSVVEAMVLVTLWGVRDRMSDRRAHRMVGPQPRPRLVPTRATDVLRIGDGAGKWRRRTS
ncbi:MAG: polyprenol monophosphomannose synthase [Actinomycetota bacterium]|nr:polyprenol monophosphomannose synthase [Actinomycetota bacterium]